MKKNLKIHILDNHNIIIQGIKSLLTSHGYNNLSHTNCGLDFLKYLKFNEIDVLILDLSMPVMNGFDVLKRMNKLNLSFKTIICSGYSDFNFIKESLDLGGHAYVSKKEASNFLIKVLMSTCFYYL